MVLQMISSLAENRSSADAPVIFLNPLSLTHLGPDNLIVPIGDAVYRLDLFPLRPPFRSSAMLCLLP